MKITEKKLKEAQSGVFIEFVPAKNEAMLRFTDLDKYVKRVLENLGIKVVEDGTYLSDCFMCGASDVLIETRKVAFVIPAPSSCNPYRHYVECSNCGGRGSLYDSKEEAVFNWNLLAARVNDIKLG